MIKEYLFVFVQLFCDLLSWAMVLYFLASWIVGPGNRFYDFLADLTKPILSLAKRITPMIGMLDLSPMVAIMGLEIVKNVLLEIIKLL